MTTAATRPSGLASVTKAMRLHTVTLPQMLAWIAAILAAIFTIQYAILLAAEGAGEQVNSSVPIVLTIFLFVYGVQSAAQTLPFALSLGLTRRAYFASTLAYAVALALVLSLAAGVIASVENATNGWGQSFTFFAITNEIPIAPVAQWTLWPLLIFTGAALGTFIGSVYLRWRTTGVWSVTLGALVLTGAITVLIIWRGWWPTIWDALMSAPLEAVVLGIPAILAALASAAAYLVVRRAPV